MSKRKQEKNPDEVSVDVRMSFVNEMECIG